MWKKAGVNEEKMPQLQGRVQGSLVCTGLAAGDNLFKYLSFFHNLP